MRILESARVIRDASGIVDLAAGFPIKVAQAWICWSLAGFERASGEVLHTVWQSLAMAEMESTNFSTFQPSATPFVALNGINSDWS
jgi:hypothetical protein